ncbi:hypothetical protein XO10_03315 [Marinitoga sp. 1135]|uniref:Uncharacterized protein n=1 Tax=Marinitoga piezophila (strain DSM 14283 / JCM 11233 / KA3) TaxID=443254 RepID=H2J630_MARPK|nr:MULTISPECIES: hypothetical protein [Marinitoga]AEX85091.1 hypothetical protein Marpi_0653 [Marinitoga piezophila KA3]APT75596.1 hypothetical protein LN42_03715 [Marinitoga sp. 1137]NUU95305.1 hypothetical protein [Marinitoga sp. 1135]NUU97239.1 hypothetical protein [Marinitoga sp. 1138]
MILLNPMIVFLGMIMYIIPYLWPLSFAITMFIYHILLKNRDVHVKRIKAYFKNSNIDNEDIKRIKTNNSISYLIAYLLSYLGFTLIFIKISNRFEKLYASVHNIEELKNIDVYIPDSEIFLFVLFLLLLWLTYIKIINRLIRDQFILQNFEIQHNLIDKAPLKYRDANAVVILRIVTFNLYEWFLLLSLIKETNTLYILSETYKKESFENKTIEDNNYEKTTGKKEDIVSEIKKIKFENKNELLSYIFSKISKLDITEKFKILSELKNQDIIDDEDIKKIKKLF